jgi:hypothetical protein
MRLPTPKVPNVPGVLGQRWPACLQGHDRIINPDRKQDGGAPLTFPCFPGVCTVQADSHTPCPVRSRTPAAGGKSLCGRLSTAYPSSILPRRVRRISWRAGLVIQCWAHFQRTANGCATDRWNVHPSAYATMAAKGKIHRLVGCPKVRGLWGSSARNCSRWVGVAASTALAHARIRQSRMRYPCGGH